MEYTEEEKKFFRDLMIKPTKMIQTGVRIALKEYMTIRKWSGDNNYPITWILRRSIKDFIKRYIETGIMPQGENNT